MPTLTSIHGLLSRIVADTNISPLCGILKGVKANGNVPLATDYRLNG